MAIGDAIANDDPVAARGWVERLRGAAVAASAMPNAARVVPEVGRVDVREVFVRSYRIVYRVAEEGIVVLTVFEGHRRLGELDADAEG